MPLACYDCVPAYPLMAHTPTWHAGGVPRYVDAARFPTIIAAQGSPAKRQLRGSPRKGGVFAVTICYRKIHPNTTFPISLKNIIENNSQKTRTFKKKLAYM